MKMLKQIGLGAFAVLFFGLSLLAFVQSPASAEPPSALGRIQFVTVSGNRVFFDSTFQIQAKFVDRAHIEVSVTGGSNADHTIDGKPLRSFIEGTYMDDDINGTFQYKDITDCSEEDGSDCWSLIDRFNGDLGTGANNSKIDSDNFMAVPTSNFWSNHLQNVELTTAIDEDLLDNISCGRDSPIVLTVNSNDQNGQNWECSDGNSGQAVDFGDIVEDITGMNFTEAQWDSSSLENFNIVLRYNGQTDSSAKLIAVDGKSENDFWFCSNSDGNPANVFVRGGCDGDEYINISQATLADGNLVPAAIVNGSNSVDIVIGGSEAEAPADFNNSGSSSSGQSCESEGGEFSWLLCPALRVIDAGISGIDNAIRGLLQIKFEDYTGPQADGSTSAIKIAWSRAQNLAFLILIPIFLVMIISTILGFGFVDAYTVKRSLPRLLVAVLFIVLSWDICRILIEMTNMVGQSLAGFIGSSVTGTNINELEVQDVFGGGEGVLLSVLTIGTAGSLVVFGMIGVLLPVILYLVSLGATMLGTLAVAFLLLGFRQMIIIALIILAPLAILSWIFPGNDKMWKLWWNSFSKLLLLYPIIILLITTGKVFAWVIFESGGPSNAGFASGLIEFTMKTVAYIGPYFLIPATFKMAGAAFGNLTGMVNDRSKGFFDKRRKRRQGLRENTVKDVKARAKGGKIFQGGNDGTRLGDWNKKVQKLSHLSNVADSGITRIGKDWKANIGSAIQSSEKEEQKHIMEDADINTWANFDDVSGMFAAVLSGDARGIKRRLMKVGVGVRVDENGKAIKDENGNYMDVDHALLSSETEKVMSSVRRGDTQSALAAGLRAAGTFSKKRVDENGKIHFGEENTDELNKNVAHAIRANRKYGSEALGQAMVKKAAAGGTYYDNAADAWSAAARAAGTDGAAKADFSASMRGILTNAGRADQGGGAFGKTLEFMDELSSATTDEEYNEAQAKYMMHVLENSPASTLFHASMKDGYVKDNIIPVLRKRAQEAYAKAQSTGMQEGTPEFNELMKVLTEIDNIHQQALATKPKLGQMIGDELMSVELMPSSDRAIALGPTGSGAAGSSTVFIPQGPRSIRSLNSEFKDTASWQNYHREWVSTEERLQQQQAAEAAQAQLAASQNRGGPAGQGPVPPISQPLH